jgi:hypothetical protein
LLGTSRGQDACAAEIAAHAESRPHGTSYNGAIWQREVLTCTSTGRGVDTSTPAGKVAVPSAGVFAEFKRAIIQERIAAGIATAPEKAPSVG